MHQFNKIVDTDIKSILRADIPWQRFNESTVLITGANGFLPAYMVETLLQLNKRDICVKVIALVRDKEKAEKRFNRWLTFPALSFLVQDVCDAINCEDKIDYVIHAASQASPTYYGSDPVGTARPNVIGTDLLLRLALKNKSKGFLFFSSSEVYGGVPIVPTSENDYGPVDPVAARSCYAESKRMGETLCSAYFRQYNLPVSIVRPYHTYGPGMQLDDGRVFTDFVSDIVKQQNIVLNSDGQATRSFCYLSDAVEAFFRVLLTGESGESYNVGNPDCEISIRDLARLLVDLFPEKELVLETKTDVLSDYVPSLVSRSCPDIQKIGKLGWSPGIDLNEGFRRTVDSFSDTFAIK